MLMDLNAGGGGGDGGGGHLPFESAKRLIANAVRDLNTIIDVWQQEHAGKLLDPTDNGDGQAALTAYVSMLLIRELTERSLSALGRLSPDAITLLVAAMAEKGNTRGDIDKYTVPEHRIGYGNRE